MMKKLDPKAFWIFLIPQVLATCFTVGFFGFWFAYVLRFGLDDGEEAFMEFLPPFIVFIIILILLLTLFFAFIAKLTYRFYFYELQSDSFKKESGIIWKKYVSIPYNRIQNVEIKRGLIERCFGLSNLRIQTASRGTGLYVTEGNLPGLSLVVAEELRDEIVQRAKNSRSKHGL
jgi:membrane protein YdbS with pleckstrin-like domain